MIATPDLTIEDFPAAFEALHGHRPYAWQMRLLDQVIKTGNWPGTIAAPTGAGKTAVLDIALFRLALQAGDKDRTAAMRIVLAVDRRIIVDQAFERAKRIKDKLQAARGQRDALGRMADRLANAADGPPLHIAELRGGMPREHDWAKRPDQPTILCTTVDQLGSRLLFRGYGVSSGMAPIHAGLLGVDALLILDEAHLSGAFAETLQNLALRRRALALPRLPWGWTSLTATPSHGAADVFRLDEDERDEDAIRNRLRASKLAKLVESKKNGVQDLAEALAEEARGMMADLSEGGAVMAGSPVVVVVVNRVALARAVFDVLKKHPGQDAILLTGRVRPAERDALVQRYRRRLEGASLAGDAPLFVVATQCIEAGADFDVDGMVSQIAPLDALRQRFGRLARTGNVRGDRGGKSAPGVILAPKADIEKKADDPLYGNRMMQTWLWLKTKATHANAKAAPVIDFGPDAMDKLIAREAYDATPKAADCIMPALRAPLLRHADIALFAMTAPRPVPGPDPSLFLHGEFRPQTDVTIIWRGDIEAQFRRAQELKSDTAQRRAIALQLATIIEPVPPRAAEALALPAWRVKAWLMRSAQTGERPAEALADTLADIDARLPGQEAMGAREEGISRLVLRWRGAEGDIPAMIEPGEIKPGDLIILPASYGGCDAFGWASDCVASVSDIADLAGKPYETKRAALRLHPGLWPKAADEVDQTHEAAASTEANAGKRHGIPWAAARDMLENAANAKQLAEALAGLPDMQHWKNAKGLRLLYPYGGDGNSEDGAILIAPAGLSTTEAASESFADPATEDDLGSFGAAAITLEQHAQDVAGFARTHAGKLALPAPVAESLVLAARWHDAGKGDERFQAFLREVGRLPAGHEPIAKSGRAASPVETKVARRASSLPDRWRHEVVSVRHAAWRLAQAEDDAHMVDPDLVLWLIGTHHGHGRPFFAHEDDWDGFDNALPGQPLPASPGPDKLDFDWNGRDWSGLMAALQDRYGVWGLAFLEACLRLADHRASAAEAPADRAPMTGGG